MFKYRVVDYKKLHFFIDDDLKIITINEFINKVNKIFNDYCYDEQIIDNDDIDISNYYDVNDLMMLLDYNPASYDINNDYVLYTGTDELASYNIYELIDELFESYYIILMEALGYDI